MSRYLAGRMVQLVLLLLGIVVISFLLIHIAPGDPIVALAGEYGDAAYYDAMRAKYGLDKSIVEQLSIYLRNLARGDLGVSYVHGQPVAQVIFARLPATLLLMGASLLLSSVLGVLLGLLAARSPHSLGDFSITTLALTGYAAPVFWLAQLLILLLALRWNLFPVQGMTSARYSYEGIRYGMDVLYHMILPVTALTVQQLALISRLTRTGLLEVLAQDYIRTAHAKGLPGWSVLGSHALRNALLPVLTVVGGRIGFMFTGAVLTETVFAWPGLGQLLISATLNRDYPILMGIFLMVSTAVLLANLLTDTAYAFFDPRIQFS